MVRDVHSYFTHPLCLRVLPASHVQVTNAFNRKMGPPKSFSAQLDLCEVPAGNEISTGERAGNVGGGGSSGVFS